MSMHCALLLIEGDFLPRADEIFSVFRYQPLPDQEEITNWGQLWRILADHRLDKSTVMKAICCHCGWTVIFDPELVMPTDGDSCADLSHALGARILGVICDGKSLTYAYRLHEGDLRRSFMVSGGKVFDDYGAPLPEEKGLKKESISEQEVLGIVSKIAFDFSTLTTGVSFLVKLLDSSGVQNNA
ncbi:MAG: hypothetical protein NTW87_06750 [Planctomycetota bacterium]|nr:hypothetical protein [Planctomycetota bacterium]